MSAIRTDNHCKSDELRGSTGKYADNDAGHLQGPRDSSRTRAATLASAAFLTPPGIPAIAAAPGRLLAADDASAAQVADALRRLADAGLTACTLWLPIAAEHVERAMEWLAAEVMPQLT